MNRLLDDENDLLEQQRDRELTLSTGAILAIFLGLVLLCAVFFGFGYNLGRKSTTPTTPVASGPAAEPSTAAPSSSTFDNFKPSPSSPAAATSTAPSSPPPIDLPPSPSASSVTVPTSPAPKPEAAAPQPVTQPTTKPAANTTKPAAPTPAVTTPRKPAVTITPAPAATHAAPPPPVPISSTPAVAPAGAFMVQVAAVSRQDDADLLVTALRAKGYQVAARLSPQDKLIHIQVGPYATRRDAEAMREKLIMDGYNAIVK